MAQTVPARQNADQRTMRHGGNVFLYLLPEKPSTLSTFPVAGIMNSAGTDIKGGGPFCTQISMDAIKKVPINEVEGMFSGGKTPVKYTDGYKIDAFKVTLSGDALSGLYAAIGQSPTTTPAFLHETVDYGKRGHLIIDSYGVPDGGGPARPMRSTLLKNVSVRIEDVPGFTADGTTTQEIIFYSNRADGDLLELQGYHQWQWEILADNATILNPSIPGTSIVLGTGNNSYASATTPTAFAFNPAATGIDQYFAWIGVNGVQYSSADGTTFVSGTSTITLSAATVVPATVLLIYAMNTASLTNIQIPNKGTGRPSSVGWHTWLGPS